MKRALFFLCFLFWGQSFTHSTQTTWQDYTASADSLDAQYKFEEALVFRNLALDAGQQEPDSIQLLLRGLQMFTQAESDFATTKRSNEEAYQLMKEAVEVLHRGHAPAERISEKYWDLNLAAFNYMRNQEDTEKFLNKSIEYHLKSPQIDTLLLLNTLHGSGYMATLSGKYEQAIETLESGIALFDEYTVHNEDDLNLKGYLYATLSLVYSPGFLNIPQKTLFYNVEAEQVFSSMSKPDLEYHIGTSIDLSKNERVLWNYRAAEGYLNNAMRLYEERGEEFHRETMHDVGYKTELDIANNFIILYREAGEEEKMQRMLNRVEEIFSANDLDQTERNQYVGILQSAARYYLHQDYDYVKAMDLLQRALKIQTARTTIHLGVSPATLRMDQAVAHLLRQDYGMALQIIASVEKKHVLEPYQTEVKAKSLLGLGQREAAVTAVHQILQGISPDNEAYHFPDAPAADFMPGHVITDAQGLVGVAQAFRRHDGGYSQEEETLYWLALAQMEANRGSMRLNKALKETYDQIIAGLMEAAMEREFSPEESNRLLSFQEVMTSQEHIHQFLLRREIAGNTPLFQWVEEEQYLRSYITYLKKELQREDDAALRQQLFDKERALQKNQEQMASAYVQRSLFSLPDIDISAKYNKNIIKFHLAGDQLYRTRLYQGALTYARIPDFPALKGQIEQFLADINDLETPTSQIMSVGEELFLRLLGDAMSADMPTVIIPDGILHYLPFELLVEDGDYLIQHHTISYASNFYFLNAGQWKAAREGQVHARKSNRQVVFFAPEYAGSGSLGEPQVRGASFSLKGATGEVKDLSAFLSGRSFVGRHASKTNFRSLDGHHSVLHLAMHSNLNDSDPELSNLLFSNVEEDHEMYISELYGLNFNSDLAVLSACNTGVGGFQDGGNLVSMHQAFTTAGIPATVASLWNAPDQSTRELMIAFYRNLQAGQDKASALRQAKLSYLSQTNDENLRHPFYWAAFVLSGDDAPIILSAASWWKKPVLTGLLIGGLLISGGLLWWFRRKRWLPAA